MIIAAVQYGPMTSRNFPKYTVTSGTAPLFLSDSSGNWELVFKANCKIVFDKLPTNADIFEVGGGKPGNTDSQAYKNSYDDAYCKTAAGGKGGGRVKSSNVTLNTGAEYTVTIGASGMSTSAFGLTATSGAGSNGGTGAEASKRTGNTYHVAATAGADGDYAFGADSFDAVTPEEGDDPAEKGWYVIVNEKYIPTTDVTVQSGTTYYASNSLYNPGAKYGPGGGAGSATASDQTGTASAGGDDGGGDGSSGNGAAGDPNTGGGGASGARVAGGSIYSAGAGGSGIVIIRNARSST